MRRAFLITLVALALGVVTPAAFAAPPDQAHPVAKKKTKPGAQSDAPREQTREERIEQARQLYLAAEERFQAGDFPAALAGFRAANEVARSPQAIFRIALCLEKVGTPAEAENAFHRFLGLPPPPDLAAERLAAEDHLAALAAGTLRISSQPVSISVAIDGKPGGHTPLEVRLPAGAHLVTASAPDYEPASREVDVTRGGVMELAVALKPVTVAPEPVAPPPAASPAEVPSAGRNPLLVSVVAYGLAAVGIGVGTAFGVRALNAQSDYNRTPTSDLADSARNNAVVSDGAFAGAIAAAVIGTVLITHRGAPAPPAVGALRLAPILGPRTQGAAAVVRF